MEGNQKFCNNICYSYYLAFKIIYKFNLLKFVIVLCGRSIQEIVLNMRKYVKSLLKLIAKLTLVLKLYGRLNILLMIVVTNKKED